MRTYGVDKAFRFVEYTERVVKSEEKRIGKDLFDIISAQHVLSYHLI